MLIVLQPDYEEVSREAARTVSNAVWKKSSLTLGLATGHTMIGVYKEIVPFISREDWTSHVW